MNFYTLFLLSLILLSQPSSASQVWHCDQLMPSFAVSKHSAKTTTFGHYSGSCLRTESEDGVYFVCEKETLCGTGLNLDAHIMADLIQSEKRRKIMVEKEFCKIYVVQVRVILKG